MIGKDNRSFRTSGVSNISRFRDSLYPSYFGIDERSLSDILSFVLRFSKSVRYIDKKNEEDGNWAPFLENDLAFVIALIACEDLVGYDQKFKETVGAVNTQSTIEEQAYSLRESVKLTFQLFQKVDSWYKSSRNDVIHLQENQLSKQLQNAIRTKLADQFRDFTSLVDSFNPIFFSSDTLEFDLTSFDHLWGIEEDEKNDNDELENNQWNIRNAVIAISRVHNAVISVATYIKSLAPQMLQHTLEQYPYHKPHVSLLLSFLKLFERVQSDTNAITKRHLDYYYGEILRQRPNPSEPDHVHVYFDVADHIVKSNVEAGALLAAGIDEEGLVYTYATDFGLELNRATISDINIIHVARNPLIGVGNTFNSVSNIYSKTITLDEQGIALDLSNNPAAFDTFGKDQADISYETRDMQQAKIGFAISSSILLLKEGERSISLVYKFNLNSLSALISFVEETTVNESLSPENAFYKLLSNIFKIRCTTEKGWYEIENYEILPPDKWISGEIRIELILNVDAPAITAYDPEMHGEEYETQWPILEFALVSQHSMYGYSFLKDLQIDECRIDVNVEKAKDLLVFNDLGQLDITKPFYPFGSTPDFGSYFLVGSDEMFLKEITDFSLDIHWHNAPKQKGGFKSYYKEYNTGVDSSSFKVGITYLSNFRFHPVSDSDVQRVPLFSDDKVEKKTYEEIKIEKIDLDKLELKPDYNDLELDDYTSKTQSGFFKLEIVEPESGFGHALYSKLFANAVLANSKASSGLLSKDDKKVEIPNEPYAPQIRTLTLNYSATSKLLLNVNKVGENDKANRNQLYHLHPYGNRIVFDQGLPKTDMLVPQFDDEGYLFLGIEELQPPSELTLYFEMVDDNRNDINHFEVPEVKWSYLIDDDWVDFEDNEIVFDSTNCFTTSGLVKLKVPMRINKSHGILANGKFWLSARVKNKSHLVSKTVLIQTNGVSATWKPHKPDEQWQANIDANTISGFIDTRSDVNAVHQLFPSFGGKQKETHRNYYTRVSERLKHKNRAVIPEDFEKIILEAFPFLFQVKCINNFSHPEFVQKGHVKLIVVPKLQQGKKFYPPKVDIDRLNKIKDLIRPIASPNVHIDVINPVYEKVKVSFKVVLASNSNTGEYVRQIEDELLKFICPWFGPKQEEMDFGGSIERDDILTFIESLPYVRFVTKLSVVVLHNVDGNYDISDSASNDGKANELKSSRPWSVLIPSTSHEIELMDKPAYEAATETRIETMKIGDDFVITKEKEEDVEFPIFDIDKDTYFSIEIDL